MIVHTNAFDTQTMEYGWNETQTKEPLSHHYINDTVFFLTLISMIIWQEYTNTNNLTPITYKLSFLYNMYCPEWESAYDIHNYPGIL